MAYKDRVVEFNDGGNTPFFRPATLDTDDKELIDYIKGRADFGTYILQESEPEPEEQAPAADAVIYDEVTTVQGAKDALVKNHEIAAARLVNKNVVLEIAKELNVVFPNLPK